MSNPTDSGFLGEEFLTWLWFTLETEGGDFDVDGREIAVCMDDYIAFAPSAEDETEQTLRKGLPSRSSVAREALRNGRCVRKTRLIAADGAREWGFVLDAATMNITGIRLPADSEEAQTPRERATERIAAFTELQDIIVGLYTKFLSVRLTPDYRATQGEAQANWMMA